MMFLFNLVLFMFHVNFQGCIQCHVPLAQTNGSVLRKLRGLVVASSSSLIIGHTSLDGPWHRMQSRRSDFRCGWGSSCSQGENNTRNGYIHHIPTSFDPHNHVNVFH